MRSSLLSSNLQREFLSIHCQARLLSSRIPPKDKNQTDVKKVKKSSNAPKPNNSTSKPNKASTKQTKPSDSKKNTRHIEEKMPIPRPHVPFSKRYARAEPRNSFDQGCAPTGELPILFKADDEVSSLIFSKTTKESYDLAIFEFEKHFLQFYSEVRVNLMTDNVESMNTLVPATNALFSSLPIINFSPKEFLSSTGSDNIVGDAYISKFGTMQRFPFVIMHPLLAILIGKAYIKEGFETIGSQIISLHLEHAYDRPMSARHPKMFESYFYSILRKTKKNVFDSENALICELIAKFMLSHDVIPTSRTCKHVYSHLYSSFTKQQNLLPHKDRQKSCSEADYFFDIYQRYYLLEELTISYAENVPREHLSLEFQNLQQNVQRARALRRALTRDSLSIAGQRAAARELETLPNFYATDEDPVIFLSSVLVNLGTNDPSLEACENVMQMIDDLQKDSGVNFVSFLHQVRHKYSSQAKKDIANEKKATAKQDKNEIDDEIFQSYFGNAKLLQIGGQVFKNLSYDPRKDTNSNSSSQSIDLDQFEEYESSVNPDELDALSQDMDIMVDLWKHDFSLSLEHGLTKNALHSSGDNSALQNDIVSSSIFSSPPALLNSELLSEGSDTKSPKRSIVGVSSLEGVACYPSSWYHRGLSPIVSLLLFSSARLQMYDVMCQLFNISTTLESELQYSGVHEPEKIVSKVILDDTGATHLQVIPESILDRLVDNNLKDSLVHLSDATIYSVDEALVSLARLRSYVLSQAKLRGTKQTQHNTSQYSQALPLPISQSPLYEQHVDRFSKLQPAWCKHAITVSPLVATLLFEYLTRTNRAKTTTFDIMTRLYLSERWMSCAAAVMQKQVIVTLDEANKELQTSLNQHIVSLIQDKMTLDKISFDTTTETEQLSDLMTLSSQILSDETNPFDSDYEPDEIDFALSLGTHDDPLHELDGHKNLTLVNVERGNLPSHSFSSSRSKKDKLHLPCNSTHYIPSQLESLISRGRELYNLNHAALTIDDLVELKSIMSQVLDHLITKSKSILGLDPSDVPIPIPVKKHDISPLCKVPLSRLSTSPQLVINLLNYYSYSDVPEHFSHSLQLLCLHLIIGRRSIHPSIITRLLRQIHSVKDARTSHMINILVAYSLASTRLTQLRAELVRLSLGMEYRARDAKIATPTSQAHAQAVLKKYNITPSNKNTHLTSNRTLYVDDPSVAREVHSSLQAGTNTTSLTDAELASVILSHENNITQQPNSTESEVYSQLLHNIESLASDKNSFQKSALAHVTKAPTENSRIIVTHRTLKRVLFLQAEIRFEAQRMETVRREIDWNMIPKTWFSSSDFQLESSLHSALRSQLLETSKTSLRFEDNDNAHDTSKSHETLLPTTSSFYAFNFTDENKSDVTPLNFQISSLGNLRVLAGNSDYSLNVFSAPNPMVNLLDLMLQTDKKFLTLPTHSIPAFRIDELMKQAQRNDEKYGSKSYTPPNFEKRAVSLRDSLMHRPFSKLEASTSTVEVAVGLNPSAKSEMNALFVQLNENAGAVVSPNVDDNGDILIEYDRNAFGQFVNSSETTYHISLQGGLIETDKDHENFKLASVYSQSVNSDGYDMRSISDFSVAPSVMLPISDLDDPQLKDAFTSDLRAGSFSDNLPLVQEDEFSNPMALIQSKDLFRRYHHNSPTPLQDSEADSHLGSLGFVSANSMFKRIVKQGDRDALAMGMIDPAEALTQIDLGKYHLETHASDANMHTVEKLESLSLASSIRRACIGGDISEAMSLYEEFLRHPTLISSQPSTVYTSLITMYKDLALAVTSNFPYLLGVPPTITRSHNAVERAEWYDMNLVEKSKAMEAVKLLQSPGKVKEKTKYSASTLQAAKLLQSNTPLAHLAFEISNLIRKDMSSYVLQHGSPLDIDGEVNVESLRLFKLHLREVAQKHLHREVLEPVRLLQYDIKKNKLDHLLIQYFNVRNLYTIYGVLGETRKMKRIFSFVDKMYENGEGSNISFINRSTDSNEMTAEQKKEAELFFLSLFDDAETQTRFDDLESDSKKITQKNQPTVNRSKESQSMVSFQTHNELIQELSLFGDIDSVWQIYTKMISRNLIEDRPDLKVFESILEAIRTQATHNIQYNPLPHLRIVLAHMYAFGVFSSDAEAFNSLYSKSKERKAISTGETVQFPTPSYFLSSEFMTTISQWKTKQAGDSQHVMYPNVRGVVFDHILFLLGLVGAVETGLKLCSNRVSSSISSRGRLSAVSQLAPGVLQAYPTFSARFIDPGVCFSDPALLNLQPCYNSSRFSLDFAQTNTDPKLIASLKQLGSDLPTIPKEFWLLSPLSYSILSSTTVFTTSPMSSAKSFLSGLLRRSEMIIENEQHALINLQIASSDKSKLIESLHRATAAFWSIIIADIRMDSKSHSGIPIQLYVSILKMCIMSNNRQLGAAILSHWIADRNFVSQKLAESVISKQLDSNDITTTLGQMSLHTSRTVGSLPSQSHLFLQQTDHFLEKRGNAPHNLNFQYDIRSENNIDFSRRSREHRLNLTAHFENRYLRVSGMSIFSPADPDVILGEFLKTGESRPITSFRGACVSDPEFGYILSVLLQVPDFDPYDVSTYSKISASVMKAFGPLKSPLKFSLIEQSLKEEDTKHMLFRPIISQCIAQSQYCSTLSMVKVSQKETSGVKEIDHSTKNKQKLNPRMIIASDRVDPKKVALDMTKSNNLISGQTAYDKMKKYHQLEPPQLPNFLVKLVTLLKNDLSVADVKHIEKTVPVPTKKSKKKSSDVPLGEISSIPYRTRSEDVLMEKQKDDDKKLVAIANHATKFMNEEQKLELVNQSTQMDHEMPQNVEETLAGYILQKNSPSDEQVDNSTNSLPKDKLSSKNSQSSLLDGFLD